MRKISSRNVCRRLRRNGRRSTKFCITAGPATTNFRLSTRCFADDVTVMQFPPPTRRHHCAPLIEPLQRTARSVSNFLVHFPLSGHSYPQCRMMIITLLIVCAANLTKFTYMTDYTQRNSQRNINCCAIFSVYICCDLLLSPHSFSLRMYRGYPEKRPMSSLNDSNFLTRMLYKNVNRFHDIC